MNLRTRHLAWILGMALLLLLPLLLACEGTITIEESTEEADGSRTFRVSSEDPDEPTGTPGPTATPRPRIDFLPGTDGAALTALFDASGGENWSNSEGWLYTEDLGQWHGVTTGAEGRVTTLDLSGNGLSGELPEDVGSLTGLTELDLSDNGLSGALPSEVGDLIALEELYLNGNQFSGALPSALSSLTALTDLHLHDNGFGAEFPAALGSLSALESVTIWGNKFSWADDYAPGLLADVVGLVALYQSAGGDNWSERSGWLSDPSVSAWSGVSIGGDGSVTGLDLSENRLTGELPPQIGNLAGLTSLHLSGNQMEGEIPESIGSLTGLTELSLHSNQLGGSLPAEIGNLTALAMLSLHSNQLSGNLPAGIGGMADLEELSVHTNRLSGPVPAELGNLGNLETLWLHDNQFSGELPAELANLPGLEQVSLFGNRFTWADSYAPGIVADMVGLIALYESTSGESWNNNSNWLTLKPVGEWHGVTVGAGGLIAELELSDNGLNGELPPQLGSLANLEHLGLWRNQLTGNIPPQLGDLSKLHVLGIAGNQLSGEIPYQLGGLANLTHLNLDVNGLSGSIPAELGNLANLKELWLSQNQLTGPVPAQLGKLSNLTMLRIENNNLSGVLPSELGDLPLREVSIWGNQFTGADHYENGLLSDMVALVALYESANGEEWQACDMGREPCLSPGSSRWQSAAGSGGTWPKGNWLTYKPLGEWASVTTSGEGGRVIELDLNPSLMRNVSGKLPPELGLLTALEKLSIFSQELTDEIPPEIGKLENLEHLVLHLNGLSGPIPPALGNLSSLKRLNLRGNALSGPVPPELSNLSNLTHLWLDSNQLSGELPSQLGNLSGLRHVSIWDNKLTWADHYENGLLSDLVALVALYEAANGEEWQACDMGRKPCIAPLSADWQSAAGSGGSWPKGNWLTYRPLGEWASVTTSGEGGRVVEIDLNPSLMRNVSGKLPQELGLLTGLEKLNIEGQGSLTGCVPASLRSIDYTGALPFC